MGSLTASSVMWYCSWLWRLRAREMKYWQLRNLAVCGFLGGAVLGRKRIVLFCLLSGVLQDVHFVDQFNLLGVAINLPSVNQIGCQFVFWVHIWLSFNL